MLSFSIYTFFSFSFDNLCAGFMVGAEAYESYSKKFTFIYVVMFSEALAFFDFVASAISTSPFMNNLHNSWLGQYPNLDQTLFLVWLFSVVALFFIVTFFNFKNTNDNTIKEKVADAFYVASTIDLFVGAPIFCSLDNLWHPSSASFLVLGINSFFSTAVGTFCGLGLAKVLFKCKNENFPTFLLKKQ